MRVSAFAVLLLIPGCQGDPNVEFYTTSRPDRADVVGKYTLTNQTVQSGGLSALPGEPGVIELRDDGTFMATNVPSRDSDPGDEDFFHSLVDCSGTWKIDTIGSIANGDHPPKQQWGVEFEGERSNTKNLGLTGSSAPYGLIMTFGDPDAGKVIVFERAK
jgi:hypothetical protein